LTNKFQYAIINKDTKGREYGLNIERGTEMETNTKQIPYWMVELGITLFLLLYVGSFILTGFIILDDEGGNPTAPITMTAEKVPPSSTHPE